MTQPQKLRRVLVGVDLEDSSASAVAAAGVLARMFGATVTVVHAQSLEMPAYFTDAQMDALEAEREEGHARVATELQEFAARRTDVPVSPLVEEGTPAAVILRAAPAYDLVVVGTHRLHGPRRWWLGSVAEAVVREATVPVLVVPAAASPARLAEGATIVAAGPASPQADEWIAAFGDALNGPVIRAGELAHCGPEAFRDADLVVVALPAGSTAGHSFDAVVRVLKECAHPVLFVPSRQGAQAADEPFQPLRDRAGFERSIGDADRARGAVREG